MSSTLTPPPTGPMPDPQQQYYGQAGPAPVVPRSRSAVAGLVCAFLFFPAGIVASIIGILHTKPEGKRGRGLAIAGLIISAVGTVFWIVMIAVAVTAGSHAVSAASTAAKAAAPAPSPTAVAATSAPAVQSAAPSSAAKASSSAPAKASAAPSTSAAPAVTMSQTQALRSAKIYLSTQPFSYAGLIKQLSSSVGGGFSVADATYAADHVDADWNAQAAKAAKQYLSTQAFSHAALVKQLDSPYGGQFTPAQAEYGVTQAGL